MIQWFYRHVFRGYGFMIVAGMITLFILAVWSLQSPPQARSAPATASPNHR